MSSVTRTGTTGSRHPAQLLALIIGIVYLLVGVVGFFVTGFDDFAGVSQDKLIVFQLNPLHNIVHLLIGGAGVALSKTLDGARTYGLLLAVIYGLTFLYGLVIDKSSNANFLSLNAADDVLHVLSALAGVAIFVMAKRPARTRPA